MHNGIGDGTVQNAAKDPIEGPAALDLLEETAELFVARGRRVLRFDLMSQRPPDDELLGLLLGRSGKLRAPALRYRSRLIVGYNQDLLAQGLG